MVLCVVSDSRAGSTLLQGLLSQHPDIDAAGEIRRLEDIVKLNRPCSCGTALADCGHWRDVFREAGISIGDLVTQRPGNRLQQRIEEAAGLLSVALRTRHAGRWLLPRGRRVADCVGRLLKAKAKVSGTPAVIDCSKDPGHLVYLLHQDYSKVRPLFLVRDGRATVHSKMTRGRMSAEVATRNWLHITRAMIWLRRLIGPKRSDWIRYEELCTDPSGTIARIAANAGLSPSAADKPIARHYVGGSPNFSMDSVQEDQRWRSGMTPDDLATFERIAGNVNRSLGYCD